MKKSNAAWICGLVAFVTSIPNAVCSLLCAGMATAVAETNNPGSGDSVAAAAATVLWISFLVSIVCFALSFMGKSRHSFVTGIILIIGGIFIVVTSIFGFGSILWGVATGVLYFVSGIVSILNKKRD